MNVPEEEFIFRETNVIFASQCSHEHLRPERLRIQIDKKVSAFPLDIGSFAYEIRAKREKAEYGKDISTKVVLDSFKEHRRELLICMLEFLSSLKSHYTILGYFRGYRAILDWCDENNNTDAFIRAHAVVPAYQAYTKHLNHRISIDEISPSSASKLQEQFRQLAEIRFPDTAQKIKRAVIPIVRKNSSNAPPEESRFVVYFNNCLAIARQLSEFILNNDDYPFVFRHNEVEVVHFPSTRGSISSLSQRVVPLYNHAERRISTVEEYLKASPNSTRHSAEKSVRNAQLNIGTVNSNSRHPHRLNIASLAARAYSCALLCIIGASPSEFIQFDFEEALDIEKSPVKKELSAVKFRAGGKKTRYALGRKNGLAILREYIKLRTWILDGREYDKLFFITGGSGSTKVTNSYEDLMVTFTWFFYRSVRDVYLDSKIPNVTATAIRKYKSSILHLIGTPSSDVADVLNHKVSTNLNYYSEARIEQQKSEFGDFWQSVRRAAELVLERSQRQDEHLLSIATGHCDSFNDPRPAVGSALPVIEPNCRTQYGCLYCEHYVCHSDEIDMHKLISLQYVINAVRNTAHDIGHTETLYKDLSVRIEFILEAIRNRSEAAAELIERVKYKVHELGELTAFWEVRLQRYEKLGVVF